MGFHELQVYHRPNLYTIKNVDTDRYGRLCLLSDVRSHVFRSKPCRTGEDISVTYCAPDSDEFLPITSDKDVMDMFRLYEGTFRIPLWVDIIQVPIESEVMESSGSARPGTNKRKWTAEEEKQLVYAMVDLINDGRHKADNGFKSGYLTVLEKALKITLPTSGIKGKPHIDSKIRSMKKEFTIVYDMLHGTNNSGFRYNNETKMVTAKDSDWETYCESHKGQSQWRYKSYPYYDELCIVFGKDRARGKDARTPADVVEELDKEVDDGVNTDFVCDGFDGADFTPSMSYAATNDMECSSKKKQKRSRSTDTFTDSLTQAATIIGKEIKDATEKFSKAMGVDSLQAEKRENICGELRKLDGLTILERNKALLAIANNVFITDAFFPLMDEEKEEFVKQLLSGDLGQFA